MWSQYILYLIKFDSLLNQFDSLKDCTIWLDLSLVCFEGPIMIIYKLKFVAGWNATHLFWYQITKNFTTMDSINIFKIYDIRTIFAIYVCNTEDNINHTSAQYSRIVENIKV